MLVRGPIASSLGVEGGVGGCAPYLMMMVRVVIKPGEMY